jgi:purine-binding chemotaxis protein CheW
MSVNEQPHQTDPMQDGQYLSFTLGGEEYGIDILRVQEIKGWEVVRPLPDTPEYVMGVLDLRGSIVPIVDMRSRFNLPHVEYTATTVIIVISVLKEDRELIMGVVVDGVSDVLDVKAAELKEGPDLGRHINTRYITGMLSREERMIVLLDVDKLFNPDELGLPEDLG